MAGTDIANEKISFSIIKSTFTVSVNQIFCNLEPREQTRPKSEGLNQEPTKNKASGFGSWF
jgi:hypothetical protein